MYLLMSAEGSGEPSPVYYCPDSNLASRLLALLCVRFQSDRVQFHQSPASTSGDSWILWDAKLASLANDHQYALLDMIEIADNPADRIGIEQQLDEGYEPGDPLRYMRAAVGLEAPLRRAAAESLRGHEAVAEGQVPEARSVPSTPDAIDEADVSQGLRPTLSDLASEAGISDDTFRRVREAAGIEVTLKGAAARNRRYSRREVDQLIEAALAGNFFERRGMAEKWAKWSSKEAANKPHASK
jgi:hypothetical protein